MRPFHFRRAGALVVIAGLCAIGAAQAQQGPTVADKARYQAYIASRTPDQLKSLKELAAKDGTGLDELLWKIEKASGTTLGGPAAAGGSEPEPLPSPAPAK